MIERYYGGFSDRDSVAEQFEEGTGSRWDSKDPFVPAADFPTDEQILFASYGGRAYEGDAYVLFRGTDGKLYEVVGSHCSCHGLEGQWTPEKVTLAELRQRNEVETTWHFLRDHEATPETFGEILAGVRG